VQGECDLIVWGAIKLEYHKKISSIDELFLLIVTYSCRNEYSPFLNGD